GVPEVEDSSSIVDSVDRGLRSSWEASPMNATWAVRAASRRASMAFIVRASRAISSSASGTGTRSPRPDTEISATRERIDSTGRSTRPIARWTNTAVTRPATGTKARNRTAPAVSIVSYRSVSVPTSTPKVSPPTFTPTEVTRRSVPLEATRSCSTTCPARGTGSDSTFCSPRVTRAAIGLPSGATMRTRSTPDEGSASDTRSSAAPGPRWASELATSTARSRSVESIALWTADRRSSHAPPAVSARTTVTTAVWITVEDTRIGHRRGGVRATLDRGIPALVGCRGRGWPAWYPRAVRESTHDGPEPRLGLTFSEVEGGGVHWHQPVGDQFVDPSGRFATGGLAVLVDSGIGAENHRRRPAGAWTVTTELRIDLLAPPRDGSAGLGVRTDHLGDDGHCLTSRGEVLDDDGRVVAGGLVKSMAVKGVVDPEGYDDEPPWPSALVPGTLAEVLCLSL